MKFDLVISVVLYHNTPAQVKKILESTACQTLKIKLVLIDNAPGHNNFIKETTLPAYAEYRPLQKNIGYGAGHNKAIADPGLESRYHLILNPDVYFDPEVLQQLAEYMDTHPETGLVMPKITWPDGRDQGLRKLLPTPFDLLARRFLPGPFQKLFAEQQARYELSGMDSGRSFEVPVLSGCFMFCRSKWLKEIGGFDERFFLYLEDVDLSRRMLAKGRNRYWPEISVVHEYQKDSYKSRKHLQRHLRSAWQYFNKYGWLIDPTRKRINRDTLRQDTE